ncbi:MAG: Anhydro-N-acetylmuramic acid kinase [Pseudomonadota bacterium]|jgi:anhydro-N-acetylmuramic acid kinase
MKPTLLTMGVMTGNSLDAVDVVITKLSPDNGIHDAQHYARSFPPELASHIRAFREVLRGCDGDIARAEKQLPIPLSEIHAQYIKVVGEACLATIVSARTARTIPRDATPDLVGFHGQTCAHLPPSIARQSAHTPYTMQLGDAQALANILDIPVAYDFRSDDIMNGGEGAPFAPMHHLHLALQTKSQGAFPIVFVNGGNTGNISVITNQIGKKDPVVLGWDTGPFNHFPDLLARREAGIAHDMNGEIGLPGTVNESLLRLLFTRGAITKDGANFLTQTPPRSSDPQWYRELPELLGTAPVDGVVLSLADRMRTAEYFSAYLVMFSLSFIPADCEFPAYFGLCGGGWKNPVVTNHFRSLMRKSPGQIILKEHERTYSEIISRLGKRKATVESSSAFGFDPNSMEARIFADAAARLVWGEPFTQPSVTGVSKPTLCGRIRFPANKDYKGYVVGRALADAGTLIEVQSTKGFRDSRFGRAIPGWKS